MNIIFIHKGKSKYLDLALKQAHKSNPDATIILLGENYNNRLNFVKYYNINEYKTEADNFKQYYKHFSTNSYNFELFCFQRWFILKDFINKHKIKQFFYCDSDVLLFNNLIKDNNFKKFNFTLSEEFCAHNSFWNKSNEINLFCNFLKNVYTKNDQKTYNQLLDFWRNHQKNKKNGGICDMTLFNLYKKINHKKIGETSIIINNSTYDHNINTNKQGGVKFQNIFKFKKIIWINHIPYVKTKDKNIIKFNSLHFQGNAKRYMERAYNNKKINPIYIIIKKNLKSCYFKLKKLKNTNENI